MHLLSVGDFKAIRGTLLQKHKNRVTMVLCINGDGTHSVPVHCIGKSALPAALKDPTFSHLRSQYSSQVNGRMDSKQFTKWIDRWYNEVRKLSDGL